MNLRDRIGIVHACLPASEPGEGRTRCGQVWLTFLTELFWQETQDEVDCMACVASKAHMENLQASLRDFVEKWRRDPLSIAGSPVQARVEVLDSDTIAISVHDEIIVP